MISIYIVFRLSNGLDIRLNCGTELHRSVTIKVLSQLTKSKRYHYLTFTYTD